MSKIIDRQIEALNDALREGDTKLFNELKEKWGFITLEDYEKEKREALECL